MSLAAQILGGRFAALAHEGASGFAAMSRAPLVIEEAQYACAILDAGARLIAQDQGEPSHLAAVQASVAHALDAFAFNLAEGDVLVTGDPYCGGTWAGVLTVIVPVFWEGDLRFLTALRFAAADLAGHVPGPFQPDAHEIWQESLRITPVKLVRAGAPQKDVRAYITRNSRAPALLDSDLTTAMVTATRIGAAVAGMIAQKGLALTEAAAEARIAYGAARAQAALAGLTAGTGQQGGVSLRLTPGARLRVDLTGAAASSGNAANMTRAASCAVVLTQLLADVIEDAGLSQGLLDAIEIVTTPGTILDAAFPAALSCGWRSLAPDLSAALAGAMGRQPAFLPAPPLLMLFDEIGAGPVTQPVALSPGFTPMPGCAGSDAASGRRRIISAEEAEMAGRFTLHRREQTGGAITATLTITAPAQEAVIAPGPAPDITGATARARSNVLSLPPGSTIRFTYPQGGA